MRRLILCVLACALFASGTASAAVLELERDTSYSVSIEHRQESHEARTRARVAEDLADLEPGDRERSDEWIVRDVFGKRYGDEAVDVMHCETDPPCNEAVNGEYVGCFQMGERERQIYGDSPGVRGQSRAAEEYFVASGRDWSPWPNCGR